MMISASIGAAAVVLVARGARALRRNWRGGAAARLRTLSLVAAFAMVASIPMPARATSMQLTTAAVGPVPARTERVATADDRPTEPRGIAAPLFRAGLDLRAPPVDVPIRLRIPTLNVQASVLGVGITRQRVMDAPMGSSNDPIWQQAFWYRGGGIPGDPGTATIAGHVSGGSGPAVFRDLHELRPGDAIVVDDRRSRDKVRFVVAGIRTYSLSQLAEPAVLERIYGPGPVAGEGARAAPDGLSRLTLITCAGDLVGESYDRRLVVYAVRADGRSGTDVMWGNR